MDGHFVPNITIGPAVVKALRPHVSVPIDAHLMIAPADPYLEAFREAGCDRISIHPEAGPHLDRSLKRIRELGAKAGVVLNPSTPPEAIEWVLDDLDLVLVMTVNPGFGGQSFIPSQLKKIERMRAMIDASGRDIVLEVDGGVTPNTAAALRGGRRDRPRRRHGRLPGRAGALCGQHPRPEGRLKRSFIPCPGPARPNRCAPVSGPRSPAGSSSTSSAPSGAARRCIWRASRSRARPVGRRSPAMSARRRRGRPTPSWPAPSSWPARRSSSVQAAIPGPGRAPAARFAVALHRFELAAGSRSPLARRAGPRRCG